MPTAYIHETTIYYDEIGRGEPLLMLHGMMESGRTHARTASILSSYYRVIVPDLRGYGRSNTVHRRFPPDFYDRDAADMAALLRHLGITNARIFGVADGGEVALLLALDHPDLVRAVVALSVTGAFPPGLLDILPRIGSWVTDHDTEDVRRRSEVLREYGLEETQAMYASWKEAVRAIFAAGGDISLARAATITCPVLIVNGAEDRLNTPQMSQALADAIPDAELHLVPDTSQLIDDKYRRLFIDLVVEWLQAH
jgi:valacyclovir hydrolase